MTSGVFYRDFIAKPAGDSVAALSALFRAVHGLMRANETSLVLVPFYLGDDLAPTLDSQGGAPDGLRLYMNESDKVKVEHRLFLTLAARSQLIERKIVEVDPEKVQGTIVVNRVRRKASGSAIRRFQRRNPQASVEDFVRHSRSKKLSAPYLWDRRLGEAYPMFFDVKLAPSCASNVEGRGTFGQGRAPLSDFSFKNMVLEGF